MFEEFKDRNRTVRKFPATHVDRRIIAADLGQTQDYTAICGMRHTVTALTGDDSWELEDHGTHLSATQKVSERYDVTRLERRPLGESYVDQVGHIGQVLARPPWHGADLLIDATGVGLAVANLAAPLHPKLIVITGGFDVSEESPGKYHVPKGTLISALDAAIHRGALKFAQELQENEAMRRELLDFRRHVTAAGRMSYSARGSRNDDLVLATAMAVWWASRPPPDVFGTMHVTWG